MNTQDKGVKKGGEFCINGISFLESGCVSQVSSRGGSSLGIFGVKKTPISITQVWRIRNPRGLLSSSRESPLKYRLQKQNFPVPEPLPGPRVEIQALCGRACGRSDCPVPDVCQGSGRGDEKCPGKSRLPARPGLRFPVYSPRVSFLHHKRAALGFFFFFNFFCL